MKTYNTIMELADRIAFIEENNFFMFNTTFHYDNVFINRKGWK